MSAQLILRWILKALAFISATTQAQLVTAASPRPFIAVNAPQAPVTIDHQE